jgi:hypothetical protein
MHTGTIRSAINDDLVPAAPIGGLIQVRCHRSKTEPAKMFYVPLYVWEVFAGFFFVSR